MFAYILYRIAHFFSVRLSSKSGYALATFLSILKYYLSPRDRYAVISNLKKILPQSEQQYINRYAKQVFINFGKYLIEFFRLPMLKKEDLGKSVKLKGVEHVDNALKKGKGVIILSAHMGNWELGGIFMSLLGYPMIAVALPHSHHKVNAFFNLQREKTGVVVVPSLGMAVRRIFDALKHNKIVALVGDRDFANAGRKMDFLGAQKIIPRGPANLSLRTGASIVPGFVIRQPDDSLVIEFFEPIEPSGSEEDVLLRCIQFIEGMIRQYPTQWLLFREFWKE